MPFHPRRLGRALLALVLLATLTLAGLGSASSTGAAPVPYARAAQDDPPAPLPSRLQIPALHIDAPIWQVGFDDEGGMDSPYSFTAVGWFSPGFVPGTPGNAVIAGHVDWVDHAAVFYFIKNLSAGDQIVVTMDDGSALTFAVDEVDQYDDTDTPLDRVFGNSDAPHLNLITCGGIFNTFTHNYDHRLVVYTTLVPADPATPTQ